MKSQKKKHHFKKHHYFAMVLCLLSVLFFIKITEVVVNYDKFTDFDSIVAQNISIIQNPILTKIMIFVTSIADKLPLFFLSLALFGILLYREKIQNALIFAFSLAAGIISESVIKTIIHRIRPENGLVEISQSIFGSNYSFPSGHATMATIFFAFLIYAFKDDIKNKISKSIFIILSIFAFLVIGFSRIYLNVHWFSDVLAGFALGTFWISFFVILFASTKIIKNRMHQK